MAKNPHPTAIELHAQSRVLEIAYDDGAHFRLPAEYLRVYSPSAEVRGHSPAQAKLQVGKEAVGITKLDLVGAYALKIFFDDGHDSGLFDWPYLYRLGRAWQPLWYDYLERLKAAGTARTSPDPFVVLRERGESPAELPTNERPRPP